MAKKSVDKVKRSAVNASEIPENNTGAAEMSDVSEPLKSSGTAKSPESNKPSFIKRLNDKCRENSQRFSKLNIILLIIFPLFISSMAEIIQGKTITYYLHFLTDHPTVMIFNILTTSLIFIFLLALFKSGRIAVLVHSIIYLALSTTELFKYNTNGNHLLLSDMRLFKSVKNLKSFAYIKITWALVLAYIVTIAFFLIVFYFNPKIKIRPINRVIAATACVLSFAAIVMVPGFYDPVYKFFKIDTTAASNDILLKEKFDKNGFLAFLVQTASEDYSNRLVKPDDYDKNRIQQVMNVNVVTDGDFNGGVKPNVIFIMSESYADFRVFDRLDVDDSYYEYFDKACAEGKSGTIITPTYASWTVRSEFELMFGLPVKGINDPNMPQRELAERDLPSMAQYYNSWGYNTAYVHPFIGSFYGRETKYAHLGFKNMLFHDDQTGETDFTVDIKHFGTYVDDATVFDQLIDLVNTSDDPIYIHTTTMQNHQPYNQGEDPDDEFGNYLTWIKHTNEDLNVFLEELAKIDEPTLVFFVGDHFPSLRGETSVYNQLGLTGENCSQLYEQKYFLWSNYDADFSSVPDEKFSFFYMPYVILNIIDAPHDAFIEKMMEFMETLPIYSTSYDDSIPHNEELDLLTYDRIVGDLYSASPVTK